MRIVQLSTQDVQGGAALAAYRLHRGLREIGEDCRMAVLHKSSSDETVIPLSPREAEETGGQGFFLRAVIQGRYIDANRTEISNTLFTLPYPGCDTSSLPPIQEADLINLHWLSGFQSPVTLQRLFSLGKPVVWTLHDQSAFTGGCHYDAGCGGYRGQCTACPQLADDPFDLPASVLRDKVDLFARANLTLVTASRWLSSCARESALFQRLRVETIPYSLDTDFFSPLPKEEAKKHLGIPPQTAILLFGAINAAEKRKGFQELLAAIRQGLQDPEFRARVDGGRLKIALLGHPDPSIDRAGLPVIAPENLDSPEKVRAAYCAADFLILPSLQDNLPYAILEAFSCGTPVVAFAAGGIPEVVRDGENGRLAPVGDTRSLAQAIGDLALHPEKSIQMGRNGRRLMLEEHSLPVQARRYRSLYQELCAEGKVPGPRAAGSPPPRNPGPGEDLPVPLETALGPHLQAIYEPLLSRALKRYAPSLHLLWQAAEADRTARMEQIVTLTGMLKAAEADRSARMQQIVELTRMLKAAEADRSARMQQIVELTRMLKAAEADGAELRRQVKELNAHWTVEIRRKIRRMLNGGMTEH